MALFSWTYSLQPTGNLLGRPVQPELSLKANDDGSIDVHFGPEPPAGRVSNWIPTGGEAFFLIFRFYGPQKSLFDKTWQLPDVEHIN